MKKIFIFLLSIFFISNSFAIEMKQKQNETSDIRVEIKSQIKVLKEKKTELKKKLSKASSIEKKRIKRKIRDIDEKIKRLKRLLKKYHSFTGITG